MSSRFIWPLAALLMFSGTPALAQTAEGLEPEAPKRYGIGLYISNLAGAGLTFKQRFDNGFGYHVSGYGIAGGSSEPMAGAGVALTKEFSRLADASLYGLVAAGWGLGSIYGGTVVNVAPGVGVTWGPFMAEVGYSFYRNNNGNGLIPAFGLGATWDF